MKKNSLTLYSVVALVVLFFFAACDSNNTTRFNLRLTDAPADVEAIYIDVVSVEIHASDDENNGSWQTLDIVNAGIYNLLDFNNGMDTLLATAELPAGEISQMRLILGSNNSMVKDGVTYDLGTPSAQTSGLKFNIHAHLEEGVTYNLWIDFDAARSIVEKGNGTYSLKPVIRTFNEATSGAIKGTVAPQNSVSNVMAIIDTDTLGTITDENGYFLIRGVAAGSYRVEFVPNSGFLAKSVTGVNVVLGEVTDMGVVDIQAN